jgi:hypothetical protein
MASKKSLAAKATDAAREFYLADAECGKLGRRWATPEGLEVRSRYKRAVEAVSNLGDRCGLESRDTAALRAFAVTVGRGGWHEAAHGRMGVYWLPKRVAQLAKARTANEAGEPANGRKKRTKRTNRGTAGHVLNVLLKDPGQTDAAIAAAAGVHRASLYDMKFGGRTYPQIRAMVRQFATPTWQADEYGGDPIDPRQPDGSVWRPQAKRVRPGNRRHARGSRDPDTAEDFPGATT